MKENRIKWIDAAKGILIVLVVFDHVITTTLKFGSEYKLNYIIYSFHMPAFFVLSGLTLNIKKRWDVFFREKLLRLIAPLPFFCLFYTVFRFGFLYFFNSANDAFLFLKSLKTSLLDIILMTPDSPFSAYWFLPVLLCSELILYFLLKLDKKIVFPIMILFVIVNRFLFEKNIVFPFGLREALISIPFVYLGTYIKGYCQRLSKYGLLFLLSHLVLVFFGIITGQPFNNMYCSDIGNVFFILVIGSLGSLMLISFASSSASIFTNSALNRLGKNSLYYFAFHYYFLNLWQSLFALITVDNQILKISLDIIGTVAVLILTSLFIGLISDCYKKYTLFFKERVFKL